MMKPKLKLAYICDRTKKCSERCSSECLHTFDISHAAHKKDVTNWWNDKDHQDLHFVDIFDVVKCDEEYFCSEKEGVFDVKQRET